MTKTTHVCWRSLAAGYGWMAVFAFARAHYFLTVILGPAFGWR